MMRIGFCLLLFCGFHGSAASLEIVRSGRILAGTVAPGKWDFGNGYLESTGTHYLFANRGLGSGDFRIRARISLEAFNGSAAAFVLGPNKFGFEGSHRRMFVQGPDIGNGITIGEPEDFMTPGKPFNLLVTRKGNTYSFQIEDQFVWNAKFNVKEIKSVGLRPWRATMRIYDFTMEGNLIAAELPELTSKSKLISWSKSQEARRRLQALSQTDEFEQALLAASPGQLNTLQKAKQTGLLELAAVNLPTDPKGDNDHLGWPVATMIDDTMIVVHRTMPGHNPRVAGPADEDTTYATILRSTDGGKTWSKPYDIRDCMTEADRKRGGSVPLCHRFKFDPANRSPLGCKLHLNAIGPMRDGAVIVVTDHGVFRSEDKGLTWEHLRLAFREDRHEGPFAYVGPRIIDDPKHGLLLFAHHTIYRFRRPVDIARELAVYRSRDRGESWDKTTLKLPRVCSKTVQHNQS